MFERNNSRCRRFTLNYHRLQGTKKRCGDSYIYETWVPRGINGRRNSALDAPRSVRRALVRGVPHQHRVAHHGQAVDVRLFVHFLTTGFSTMTNETKGGVIRYRVSPALFDKTKRGVNRAPKRQRAPFLPFSVQRLETGSKGGGKTQHDQQFDTQRHHPQQPALGRHTFAALTSPQIFSGARHGSAATVGGPTHGIDDSRTDGTQRVVSVSCTCSVWAAVRRDGTRGVLGNIDTATAAFSTTEIATPIKPRTQETNDQGRCHRPWWVQCME